MSKDQNTLQKAKTGAEGSIDDSQTHLQGLQESDDGGEAFGALLAPCSRAGVIQRHEGLDRSGLHPHHRRDHSANGRKARVAAACIPHYTLTEMGIAHTIVAAAVIICPTMGIVPHQERSRKDHSGLLSSLSGRMTPCGCNEWQRTCTFSDIPHAIGEVHSELVATVSEQDARNIWPFPDARSFLKISSARTPVNGPSTTA